MQKITLLPLVFFLPACGLLNKVKKSTFQQKLQSEERLEVQESEHLHTQKQEKLVLLKKTAEGLDFQLEIWPKGKFSFSPEKGFEGEAERLLYQGQGFNVATSFLLRSVQQDSMRSQQKVVKQSAKHQVKERATHKLVEPAKGMYVMLGLLLLLFVAALCFKVKFNW